MSYGIEMQQLPAIEVAAIEIRTSVDQIGHVMGGAFQELYGHLAASGVEPVGPPSAVYSEVDPDRGVIAEVCVPVAQKISAEGRIFADVLPAERVLTTIHRGPYDELPRAYEALQRYMSEHGMAPAGRMREEYLNGPMEASPDGYETRILWPVVIIPHTAQELIEQPR